MAGSIQAPRAGLSQPIRLGIAVSYVIGLLFLGLYLNGQVPPPFGLEGLWFYAAFAALVLGEFIIEPFFTRPADALANGVALLFGAASTSLAGAEIGASAASAGRKAYLALGVTVIVVAAIAVAFKDSGGRVARASGIAAFIAGRPVEHAFSGVSSSSPIPILRTIRLTEISNRLPESMRPRTTFRSESGSQPEGRT